jgi:putative chitinase
MIARDQLRKIYAHAKDSAIDAFLDPINDTMDRYEINTPLRQCHFLAQIGHESGELRYVRELASGDAYEGRTDLGNMNPGDGRRYKGRGLIQITGRANYAAIGDDLGVNFLEQPELLEGPQFAARSAGWFWDKKRLNTYADQDALKTITKRINGGLSGLEDRKRLLDTAKAVLLA